MAKKQKKIVAHEKKNVLEVYANQSLSTVFVDNLAVTKRGDGMYFLRLTALLPEGLKEQAQIIVPDRALKKMLDVLCRICDHFPAKVAVDSQNERK